ncbi:DNA methyltransferase [Sorangium sp. So ce296]|uniref:DNA methyltransferase n=1 Tax=Sorangium sp. So ce296 TaxID=3133296 RepID=UPI003F648D5B
MVARIDGHAAGAGAAASPASIRASGPAQPEQVPWSPACTTATDCTLHQLAPYIGRIKTTIANYLISEFTSPGHRVLDPFCGSGVIPLEASLLGRQVIANDINPYGVLLTRAKLYAPKSEAEALERLRAHWMAAERRLCGQDLRTVPRWVRAFFHPETLRHALALRDELVARSEWFLIACLLGILHHQRPGFLSFPSSHLVPYLRDKLFASDKFPELYEERDVLSRMEAKVRRTYRRPPACQMPSAVFQGDSRRLRLSGTVDAVITSPPYMNELDYVRDNRLRLWFLERKLPRQRDIPKRDREVQFRALMRTTFARIAPHVSNRGVIVLVVGEASRGERVIDSSSIITSLFSRVDALAMFRLERVIHDVIPDIRRSRRDLRGTKRETVLVFRNSVSDQVARPGMPTRQALRESES